MSGNEDGDLPNNATPTMDGEAFSLLRSLMESVATLTNEMTSMKGQLESITPTIPLGTNLENVQSSHQQQGPLLSQQQAYEEARRETSHREPSYRPPPINTHSRMPPREV